MIKRIELVNFMSHSHTVIEPAEGLTVLIGPNNCGKSAVVTALQILSHNAASTYVRRHDQKNCQVIVETDDGHRVEWSRSKNGSPKYLVDGKEYDRLKGNTPPIVDEILRLPVVASDKDDFDIHFGQQREPVFLLNESGKAAAQFFASSSDAIRLVEMQSRHKSNVAQARRDVKRLETTLELLNDSVELLDPIPPLNDKLAHVEDEYLAIQQQNEELDHLGSLTRRFDLQMDHCNRSQQQLDTLGKLTTPPKLFPVIELEELANDLRKQTIVDKRSTQEANLLANLSSPPLLGPVDNLQELIHCLEMAAQTETVCQQRIESLEIEGPPALEDDKMLASLASQIDNLSKTEIVFEEKNSLLDSIAQPPSLAPIDDLHELLVKLDTANQNLNRLQREHAQVELESQEIEKKLVDWVRQFPVCPTCGAETDVKRMTPGGRCNHD